MAATPAAWLAAFGGGYLVWSALTDQSPIEQFRNAIAPGSAVPPAARAGASPAGASSGGGAPAPTQATGEDPAATSLLNGATPVLVSIGYNGHRLAAPAAVAYRAASAMFGRSIPITDSYRSAAQQADCHNRKPDLCAKPGPRAPHMLGLAIDVDGTAVNHDDPKLIAALTSSGWRQYNRTKEIWHWSWGFTG